jgi:hypothetical protein
LPLNSREYFNLSVIGIHKKDNFSINDGVFLDFSKKYNYVNPMHIKFSFYTPSPPTDQFSKEVCNLRFTNISFEMLSGNDVKTYVSNIFLFSLLILYYLELGTTKLFQLMIKLSN